MEHTWKMVMEEACDEDYFPQRSNAKIWWTFLSNILPPSTKSIFLFMSIKDTKINQSIKNGKRCIQRDEEHELLVQKTKQLSVTQNVLLKFEG